MLRITPSIYATLLESYSKTAHNLIHGFGYGIRDCWTLLSIALAYAATVSFKEEEIIKENSIEKETCTDIYDNNAIGGGATMPFLGNYNLEE